MNRRMFLAGLSALPISSFLLANEQSKFEQFLKSNSDGADAFTQEFKSFQDKYLKEFESYKNDIAKEWDEIKTTSPTDWVVYSNDKTERTVVDFAENTVEVSIRSTSNPTPDKIKYLIKEAMTSTNKKAVEKDPVIKHIKEPSDKVGEMLVAGVKFGMDTIDALINNAQLINDQDSKGEIVKVKVRLPAASVLDRTRTYLPAVQKYSKEFKLQMPLVLAIIETESAFNPMAQSHIPAFGLMQIVPHTAGLDVQRLIYNRDQQPSSKALFNPTKNIQHGCAYLHILYYKYLKNIKNPQSRLYCTIAAYNTGAGNVAKAFIGNTNINKAAATINSKSPTDVYAHLRSNLTHKEARDYVKKVTFSINKYTA